MAAAVARNAESAVTMAPNREIAGPAVVPMGFGRVWGRAAAPCRPACPAALVPVELTALWSRTSDSGEMKRRSFVNEMGWWLRDEEAEFR